MSETREKGDGARGCSCMRDGFGALPPELRPQPKKNTNLRKVTCPGCGTVYRTNRETDLCLDCEKSQGR